MNKALAILLFLGLASALCWLSARSAPTPTARPGAARLDTPRPALAELAGDPLKTQLAGSTAVALIGQSIALDATAQAAQIQADQARQSAADARAAQTATAHAEERWSTQAAAATANAIALQVLDWTATAQADQATSTAVAQASATADARILLQRTLEADQARTTATAVKLATQDAYDTRLLEQAQRRNELTNTIEALKPYVFSGVALAALVGMLVIFAPVLAGRLRNVPPDRAGRLPLLVDRFGNVYTPTRNPGPLVRLNQPLAALPGPVPLELQAATTERDQLAEIVSRGFAADQPRPGGLRDLARRILRPGQPAAHGTPRYHLFDSHETPPDLLTNPAIGEVLDGEWKEEQ